MYKLLKGDIVLNTNRVGTVRIYVLRHLLYCCIVRIHFDKLIWVSIAMYSLIVVSLKCFDSSFATTALGE